MTGDRTAGVAGTSHAESVRRLAAAMVRTGLVPGLATVAAGAVIGAVVVGSAGLWGALVGGAVALASSLLTVGLMRFSAELPVQLVMVLALGGYLLKMVALLAVMVALRGVEALHVRSLAFTFLAVVLVWAGSEVVAFKRTRIPTLVIGDD